MRVAKGTCGANFMYPEPTTLLGSCTLAVIPRSVSHYILDEKNYGLKSKKINNRMVPSTIPLYQLFAEAD
jgi:hypothetical protein